MRRVTLECLTSCKEQPLVLPEQRRLDHATIRHQYQFDAGLGADRDVEQRPLCCSQDVARLAVELLARVDGVNTRIDDFTLRRASRPLGQVLGRAVARTSPLAQRLISSFVVTGSGTWEAR